MLARIFSWLFGVGDIAGAVSGAAKVAGVAAALPLAWQFIQGHGQDVLTTITVNDALLGAGLLLVIVQVAHAARSP